MLEHSCDGDCGCGCESEFPMLHLVDEEGREVDYPVLDIVPYEGSDYAVLLDTDDEDQSSVIILRIVPTAADEAEQYEGVGDDTLMQAIFEAFQQRYNAE